MPPLDGPDPAAAVSGSSTGGTIIPPLDRSSGAAKALTDFATAKLPAAYQADTAKRAELETAGRATVETLKQKAGERSLLTAPLPTPPEHAPQQTPTDPVNAWGSAAMAVAMLASGFTRRPAVAALNAGADVMNAFRANDDANYKKSFERWKAETEYGHKLYEYQRDGYRDAIDKIEHDEKGALAQLKVLSSALGDEQMKHVLDLYGAAGAIDLTRQRDVANETAQLNNKKVREELAVRDEALAAQKALQANPNDPEAQARLKNAREQLQTLRSASHSSAAEDRYDAENKLRADLEAEWRADPKNAGKELTPTIRAGIMAQARSAGQGRGQDTGTLSDESANLLADQFILGDTQAITSLPRSGPARIKVENRIAEKMRDVPEAGRAIALNRMRMAEARAAATTAGRVTMNTELFATEAIGAGREVVRTSELFPRTELPLVNSAISAYERNTGDPKIIQFGAALNAFINAYGKMSNPTGTGIHDADKDRITKILDTNLSKGQVKAGVDQIVIEGRVMSTAAQEAQELILGRAVPHGPGGAPAPAATPATAPAAAPPPSSTAAGTGAAPAVPVVGSQAEYDALPPGAQYRAAGDKPGDPPRTKAAR